MKSTALLGIIALFALLALTGCCSLLSQGVPSNCQQVPQYQTVNEYHCEYTSGCQCVHNTITGDCDSCQCQSGTKTVCS